MIRRILKRVGQKIFRRQKPEPAAASPDSRPKSAAHAPRPQAPAHPPRPPAEKPADREKPLHREGPEKDDRRPPRRAPQAKAWDLDQFQVPPAEGKTRFHDLDLPLEVMHAIHDLGFQYCTPIQAELMPQALHGVDAAGRAQTGTGKTAAFLITAFTRLLRAPITGRRHVGAPRVLVLAPTRELVLQIEEEARVLGKYCPAAIAAVFGGVDYEKQKRQLAAPVDLVVGTPGRMLDFRRQQVLQLNQVEILVIDEADRMLDMGFIPDVRTIVYSTPPKHRRQTLFFSATLTPEVKSLSAQWTRDPIMVEIEPDHVAAKEIRQMVYITSGREKFILLYNLLKKHAGHPILIFGNRRDETQSLVDHLQAYGIRCALLSGAVPQNKRIKTLDDFRNGRLGVLVATDVAARGIHVEGIGHVINYNLPEIPEDYVHRIGRTGRAGALGTSVSFACEDDSFLIPEIEKYLGHELICSHPEDSLLVPPPPPTQSFQAHHDEMPRGRGTRQPHGRSPRGRPPPRRR